MEQEILWLVTYADGETQEEFGSSEQDVREFIARSYSHMGAIKSIQPVHGADGSEV